MINFNSADFDLLDNSNEFEDSEEWDEEGFEDDSFEEEMADMEDNETFNDPLSDLFPEDEDFDLDEEEDDFDEGMF